MKAIFLPLYFITLALYSQESGTIIYHEKTNLEKEKEQISKSIDSSMNEDPEAAQLMEMMSTQLKEALNSLGNKNMELLFNKDVQLYKKHEITADNIPPENNIDFQMTFIPSKGQDEEIYINSKKSELITSIKFMGKEFLIEENLKNSKWKIKGAQKSILGYPCILAETTKEEKTIEAWFTSQIPQPVGPKGIHGLPGAILEVIIYEKDSVSDSYEEKLTITATQIDLSSEKQTIKKPKKGKSLSSMGEFNKIVEERLKEEGTLGKGKMTIEIKTER